MNALPATLQESNIHRDLNNTVNTGRRAYEKRLAMSIWPLGLLGRGKIKEKNEPHEITALTREQGTRVIFGGERCMVEFVRTQETIQA